MAKKEQRSNKWAFILYKDSCPINYLEVLEEMMIPFILSPWHDKDINKSTGKLNKPHKHGALFFESLKSYSQVSNLLSEKLNTPSHIEMIHSPTGMLNYFTHASNPEKTLYNTEEIECGAGFKLGKFLTEQNSDKVISDIIDIIEEQNFKEFKDLVKYMKNTSNTLLNIVADKTYFFSKYLDSRRYTCNEKVKDYPSTDQSKEDNLENK